MRKLNNTNKRSPDIETLTIMIPAELKKAFKLKALKNDSTLTNLLINYIRSYLMK